MEEYPLVYFVILNYNGREHLQYCLPSVLKTEYPNYRVLVVDNASSDYSVRFVRENFPEVEILINEKNLGCSGGNNQGIKYALRGGAEYIALLNTDIIIDRRWIAEAVKVLEAGSTRVGMMGCDLHGYGKAGDLEEFRIAQARWTKAEATKVTHFPDCALIIQASVFRDIGLYDPVIFAYGDESDFQQRARKASYEIWKVNVPVWHAGAGSFGISLLAAKLNMRHMIRLGLKNDGLKGGVKSLWSLLWRSCYPFAEVNHEKFSHRRLRPYNVVFNFFLVVYAVLWNLVRLRSTLATRDAEMIRIRATRLKLLGEGQSGNT